MSVDQHFHSSGGGRRRALTAVAGLAPLTLLAWGLAPWSAHATARAATGTVVPFEVAALDVAATVTWDPDALPREVTQVIVDVTDGGRLVHRGVLPVEEARDEVDGLQFEHGYSVSVRTVADGVTLASSQRSVRTGPVLEGLDVQPVVPAVGARLPFTLALTRPASSDVTVVVTPDKGPFDLSPFEVTIPAGHRTFVASIPLVTKGIGADDAPFVSIDAAIKGAPADRSQEDFLYLPPVSSHPVTATITVPEAVPEPPAGEQGSIPVTVTLDAPSPGVTYGFEAVRADRVLRDRTVGDWLNADLTVPEGERTATIDVPITGDSVSGGDVTWLVHFTYPRYGTGSLPHTTTAQVRVLDDDAPAPDLVLSSPPYSWDVPTIGRVSPLSVHWINRGTATAKGVRLTGELSGGTPQLRVVSGRGACAVTRSGARASYACALGDVPAGSGGVVSIEAAATTPGTDVTHRAVLEAPGDPTTDDLTVTATADITGPACTIVGKIGADTLTGTAGDDVICGPHRTHGALDVVVPGAGDDTLFVNGLIDESGAPQGLKVVDNMDGVVIRGGGTDRYAIGQYSPGDQVGTVLRATAKNDVIRLTGRVGVEAGAGNDRVTVSDWAFWAPVARLDGGPGVDTLTVYSHREPVTIHLGETVVGFEKLITDAGRQTVTGSPGSDTIRTGEDADVVDVADGVGGNDTVDAGPGDDTCTADVGDAVTNCEHVTWVPVPVTTP